MDTKNIESLIKEYKKISGSMVDVKKYTWYSITHHSTSIEGSTLTESQVVNLLEYGKTAATRPYEHHLMVSDYFAAMQFSMELAKQKQPLTVRLIQDIAALVMKNTGSIINSLGGSYDVSKGELRKGSVRAGNRLFPTYTKVPGMVKKLCDDINTNMKSVKTIEDKINLAFEAHFRLVSIHPFGDGNGRTSRLIMNYIQTFYKLPLSVVYKSDRIRYINALESARKSENITPYLNFMYSQYAKFLKKEIRSLKK